MGAVSLLVLYLSFELLGSKFHLSIVMKVQDLFPCDIQGIDEVILLSFDLCHPVMSFCLQPLLSSFPFIQFF